MQKPDVKPGHYYVSVRRSNGDYRLLAGPYTNNHAAALRAVRAATDRAQADPRAAFYSFGTARVPLTPRNMQKAPPAIFGLIA